VQELFRASYCCRVKAIAFSLLMKRIRKKHHSENGKYAKHGTWPHFGKSVVEI